MKRIFLFLVISSVFLSAFCQKAKQEPKSKGLHKVLSCNIRVALEEDEANGVGWSSRKSICLGIVKNRKPDIICLQEVLKVQAEDFKAFFPKFQLVGFDGPEMDAHPTGYHGIAKNPILFSTDRYELIGAGTYWLSETPLVAGSMSWETARARHANWVRLKERKTGREFRVVNLHLDHVSNKAKLEQTKLVLEESAQYQPDFPQILVGDFNANATSEIIQSVLSAGWKDSFVEVNGDQDPGATVHGFMGKDDPKKDARKKIDFIFMKGSIGAIGSEIIRDSYKGVYPSDHYFVEADIQFH